MRRSLTPLETHLTYRDGTHWFLRTMDFRGHHSIMLTLRLHHLLLRSWSAHWFVYYNIYNASLKKRNHLPIVRTLQSQLTYQSNTNWKVRSYPPPSPGPHAIQFVFSPPCTRNMDQYAFNMQLPTSYKRRQQHWLTFSIAYLAPFTLLIIIDFSLWLSYVSFCFWGWFLLGGPPSQRFWS